MSTPQVYEAVRAQIEERLAARPGAPLRHLDIGAGEGDLIELLAAHFALDSCACDYHIERFRLAAVPISKVNLNELPLPYAAESLDVITCSEVLEHVENYRALLREAHRLLRNDGLLIVTTPNVLNLSSRLRYAVSGFANLFGPLPVKHGDLYTTGGHISPIPLFYLAHALLDAEFREIRLTVDRLQRTSIALAPFAAPLIALGWAWFLWQEHRYHTIDRANERYVRLHCSRKVLFGRTIVLSAVK